MSIAQEHMLERALKVIEIALEICGLILLVLPIVRWIIG